MQKVFSFFRLKIKKSHINLTWWWINIKTETLTLANNSTVSKIILSSTMFFIVVLLGSSVSSTEKDIDTRQTKAWTAIDRLSIIWKSDLTDEMKRSFFQAAVESILLYGCTTWTLIKRLEKKLDGNYTRMLGAILNKSGRQHFTRHQLYGHLPPITKTIQASRTGHGGHSWRSRDELISDVLRWTPSYGRAKAERPARTFIQQLCEGCSPEDLKWRESGRDIHASGTTWYMMIVRYSRIYYHFLWYIYIYIYICVCVCARARVCVCVSTCDNMNVCMSLAQRHLTSLFN